MTKGIIVILSAVCCLAASCKDKVKTTVTGWWTIDTIVYRGYEIRACLSINSLDFSKNGSLNLPVPKNYCPELITEYTENGTWKVERGSNIPLLLKIDSKNVIFKGTHQIVFRNDAKNELLKMEIKSDSLYVVCRKGLFDYDHKQGLIRDLEKMSKE